MGSGTIPFDLNPTSKKLPTCILFRGETLAFLKSKEVVLTFGGVVLQFVFVPLAHRDVSEAWKATGLGVACGTEEQAAVRWVL